MCVGVLLLACCWFSFWKPTATCFRCGHCGGIFNDRHIANLLHNVAAKNSENRPTFSEVMDNSLRGCVLTHGAGVGRGGGAKWAFCPRSSVYWTPVSTLSTTYFSLILSVSSLLPWASIWWRTPTLRTVRTSATLRTHWKWILNAIKNLIIAEATSIRRQMQQPQRRQLAMTLCCDEDADD